MGGTRRRSMFTTQLSEWAENNRRSFPWRETADPFRILVAEVLLQRSRGKTVATVYEELFRRWADARGSLPRPRRIDRLGDPAARPGEASRDPEGSGDRGRPPRRGPDDARGPPRAPRASAATRRAPPSRSPSTSMRRSSMGSPPASTVATSVSMATVPPPPTRSSGIWSSGSPRATHVREWNWAVLDLAARSACRRCRDVPSAPWRRIVPGHRLTFDRVRGKC